MTPWFSLSLPIPAAGLTLALALDPLSALFLLLVAVVAVAAAIHSPAYLRQERYRGESRLRYAGGFAVFLAGMTGTLLAADFVTFLVCWEVMSIASYVLNLAQVFGPPNFGWRMHFAFYGHARPFFTLPWNITDARYEFISAWLRVRDMFGGGPGGVWAQLFPGCIFQLVVARKYPKVNPCAGAPS